MKLLWSSDLKIHTVHSTDVVLAATLASEWIRSVGGRAKADAVAAVDLPPSGVKKDQLADLSGVCAYDKTVKAALFNIVSISLSQLSLPRNNGRVLISRLIACRTGRRRVLNARQDRRRHLQVLWYQARLLWRCDATVCQAGVQGRRLCRHGRGRKRGRSRRPPLPAYNHRRADPADFFFFFFFARFIRCISKRGERCSRRILLRSTTRPSHLSTSRFQTDRLLHTLANHLSLFF